MTTIVQFPNGERAKTGEDGWVFADKSIQDVMNFRFPLEATTGAEPNVDNTRAEEMTKAWGGKIVQLSPVEDGDAEIPERFLNQ